MTVRNLGILSLVVACFLQPCFAGGIKIFRKGEIPDPQTIAAILLPSYVAAKPIKMRGIKLLSKVGTGCDKVEHITKGAVSKVAATETNVKMRGIRLLSESDNIGDLKASAPKEVDTIVAKFADCNPENIPSANAVEAKGVTNAANGAATQEASSKYPQPARLKASLLSFAALFSFSSSSADLMPESYAQLDAIAAGINLSRPNVNMVIEAHADTVGSDYQNLLLSQKRAQAVKDYLVQRHGLVEGNLRVIGMGRYLPWSKQEAFAPENQRVEFRVDLS